MFLCFICGGIFPRIPSELRRTPHHGVHVRYHCGWSRDRNTGHPQRRPLHSSRHSCQPKGPGPAARRKDPAGPLQGGRQGERLPAGGTAGPRGESLTLQGRWMNSKDNDWSPCVLSNFFSRWFRSSSARCVLSSVCWFYSPGLWWSSLRLPSAFWYVNAELRIVRDQIQIAINVPVLYSRTRSHLSWFSCHLSQTFL